LMNRPMAYRGGPSQFFKRAESAANFGREIGLQYVHAHIRYVEAMARLGRAESAFRGLLTICPIGLEQDVPNALPRQSNAYFSSSDAAFRDRYEAGRDFDKLRTGDVGVKGGWRIYSSGPGIYTNQLISNVVGLRRHFDALVFDPVLPAVADGLTLDMPFEGRPVRYTFRVSGEGSGAQRVDLNGRSLDARRDESNPYREGGLLVPQDAFVGGLDREVNEVEVVV
jgi:1,2-beta-oligoglucan phosphorylase